MRILVTGAAGFVGTHLVRAWAQQLPHAQLYGFVRHDGDAGGAVHKRFTVDLRDAGAVREACHHLSPDWVVHLAAQSFVPHAVLHPQETWETNLWGTFHLLEALRDSGFAGRFLFVGSGDQYGKVDERELPIQETQPLRPRNPYAASKAAAELLCYQYGESYGFDVVLARAFNHIGPAQSPRFVVADFACQVAQIELGLREPVLEVGNLEVTRDFLDIDDVLEAYRCLLERGKTGEVYNVCSGRETRLIDLVQTLAGFSSRPIEIRVDPARLRPVDTPRLCGSHTKLTQQTGWKPTRDLLPALERILRYWKETVRQ
ncbi:MAG: GDP-mannose 4,6-dehydratase [Thermodesulfobacteriota bacterium]|jgi:GDP-4-dehydro-6-deoxy-D-mannose reductase